MAFNTSLEALNGIFILLNQIKDNTGTKKSGATDVLTGTVGGLGGKVANVGTGLRDTAEAVKMLSGQLLKFYLMPKGARNAIKDFVSGLVQSADIGGAKSKNFKTLTEGLLNISSAIQDMSKPLMNFAGLVKANVIDLVVFGIQKLIEGFIDIGRKRKSIDNGAETVSKLVTSFRDIGKGLMFIGTGILLLGGTLFLASKLVGGDNVTKGMAIMASSILLIVGGMALMGMMGGIIKRGVETTKDIGIGLTFLALGILGFSMTLILLGKTIGEGKGIGWAALIMMGVVGLIGGTLWLLGKIKGGIMEGALAMLVMSGALIVMSLGILAMIGVARVIQGLGRDGWKVLGLAFMSIAIAGGIFALLSLSAPFILAGVGTAILMAAGLYLLSKSLLTVVDTSILLKKKLAGDSLSDVIAGLVGASLEGILKGYKLGVEDEGAAGIFKKLRVVKKVVNIVSTLAESMEAFAKAGAISPIEGYDENGRPKFGKPVDISQVSSNIMLAFGTFLGTLIDLTGTFEKADAKELKKLGKALTGRRGIMSAITDFAEVLQIFGQFGSDQKMAVPQFAADGTPIMVNGKPKMIGVPVIQIANTVSTTFGSFIKSLGASLENLDRGDAKVMKKVGKALNKSVLESVKGFADTLQIFAKFGDKGLIPVLDANGKPTGPGVPIDKVVTNITTNFVKFIDGIVKIASSITPSKKQSMTVATSNLNMFNKELKELIKQREGIEKTTEVLGKMGLKMADFSKVLADMDTEKLANLAKISEFEIQAELKDKEEKSFGERFFGVAKKEEKAETAPIETTITKEVKAEAATAKEQEKWDNIALIIGQQVGSAVAASLRNGQFKFEFIQGGTSGVFYIEPK